MGDDLEIPIGCSTGVALVPEAGREFGMLFAKADLALHQIKKGGKHNGLIYHELETGQQEEKRGDLSNLQMIFGERSLKKTALIADRELFQGIYWAMIRLASVNNWDLHLIEFTLQSDDEKGLSASTDLFIDISANLLRNCDVILKYNANQVILLLMEPANSDYTIPVNRLLDAWKQKGKPNVTIKYQEEKISGQ